MKYFELGLPNFNPSYFNYGYESRLTCHEILNTPYRWIQDFRSRGAHGRMRHPDQGAPILCGKTYQVGAKSYREGADTRIPGK